jgi:hypothetical protein
MAIPVGFPIIEATYVVRERITQRIGLIRRHVLDGVCRFGPCTIAQLDELLGLGSDIIEHTLQELLECVPGVSKNGSKFSANAESSQVIVEGEFSKVIQQERKFIVNGVDDTLLPIHFLRQHSPWWLYPDPKKSGQLLTASGEAAKITRVMSDRMGSGREDLQRWINSSDIDGRKMLGIPPGGFGDVEEPESVESVWITSFLLVDVTGSLSMTSLHRNAVPLLDSKLATSEYLLQVCKRLKSRDIDHEDFLTALDELNRRFGDFADLSQGENCGEVGVSVADVHKMVLSVPGSTNADVPEPLAQLTNVLLRGRYWCYGKWFVLYLVPGDAETATRLTVLRALDDLRRILRKMPMDGHDTQAFDLPVWWESWQADRIPSSPKKMHIQLAPLQNLLDAADEVPDTEFLEKLECFR